MLSQNCKPAQAQLRSASSVNISKNSRKLNGRPDSRTKYWQTEGKYKDPGFIDRGLVMKYLTEDFLLHLPLIRAQSSLRP